MTASIQLIYQYKTFKRIWEVWRTEWALLECAVARLSVSNEYNEWDIGNYEKSAVGTLMIKRTISVEMIIALLQQMILCDYITDVSRNLTFIIFIADGILMKLKTYDKFYNCGPSAELSKYNFIKTFIKKLKQQ